MAKNGMSLADMPFFADDTALEDSKKDNFSI
jgi:hypothetical protein